MTPTALPTYQAKLSLPFAVLGIRTVGERLAGIDYLPRGVASLAAQTRCADEVCRQVLAYLDDPTFKFDLELDLVGSAFQRRVWDVVRRIHSGQTMTYAAVARELQSAPRPVGGACGANQIPLVIPCHRVIASNGIGGFMHSRKGSPIDIKRWLLRHEGVIAT
jgi:methylated-DNA-[protein]-cysteine S-methyltransferase